MIRGLGGDEQSDGFVLGLALPEQEEVTHPGRGAEILPQSDKNLQLIEFGPDSRIAQTASRNRQRAMRRTRYPYQLVRGQYKQNSSSDIVDALLGKRPFEGIDEMAICESQMKVRPRALRKLKRLKERGLLLKRKRK